MTIQHMDTAARETVGAYIRCLWGGPMVASRGKLLDTRELPGFVAVEDGALLGAALYRMDGGECEVAALFSLVRGMGIGTKLLDAVTEAAKKEHARRVWLITTNDNTGAIRFYQKYGMALAAVHIGAMAEARRLKPAIPERGEDGIPIAHEFEFERVL